MHMQGFNFPIYGQKSGAIWMILPYRVRLKTFEWDQMQADESGIADIFITRSTTILQLGQLFLINLNKQWGFDKQIITMKLNSSFGLEGDKKTFQRGSIAFEL